MKPLFFFRRRRSSGSEKLFSFL